MEKIVKLLSLTQSDNDHEALAAIRTANAILKSKGKSWSDFINQPIKEIKKNITFDEALDCLLTLQDMLSPLEYRYVSQAELMRYTGVEIDAWVKRKIIKIYKSLK